MGKCLCWTAAMGRGKFSLGRVSFFNITLLSVGCTLFLSSFLNWLPSLLIYSLLRFHCLTVFVPLEFFPYLPPTPLISIHPLLFCIYKGFHGVPCLFLSLAALPYFYFSLSLILVALVLSCYGTRRKKEKELKSGVILFCFWL